MSTPTRGLCPVCRRRYQLRADSTIRHHADHSTQRRACPGVGQHPARPVPAEDVPTGRFGGPRPKLRPARPPDPDPDPDAEAHRAALAAAIRRAA